MMRRLNLYRWSKAVSSFGLASGTAAFASFALPRAIRSKSQAPKRMRIAALPHPIWLRPATTDWVVMEQVFMDRAYGFSQWPDHDRAIRECYECALRRDQTPVIIDCGAHIGLAALWFAEQYPAARIFAVEPAPENFDLLARNAAPYPNITPVHAAISDHHARVGLLNAEGEPWAWKTIERPDGDVATVTVGDLMLREPGGVPLIVKVDIEGGEIGLFHTNVDWVERTPLIVIELHDWQGGWRGAGHAVFSCLSAHPRDYMVSGESVFSFAHSARGI